jgi:hypothetical protein
MILLSTGLMVGILVDSGLQQVMTGGVIRLYGGVRPLSANLPLSANPLLAEISQDGVTWVPQPIGAGGLLLNMRVPGFLEKSGAWVVTGKASGTATWWRWYGPGIDDGAYSSTLPRIDGDCVTDLALLDNNYALTDAYSEPFDRFVVGFSSAFGAQIQ